MHEGVGTEVSGTYYEADSDSTSAFATLSIPIIIDLEEEREKGFPGH